MAQKKKLITMRLSKGDLDMLEDVKTMPGQFKGKNRTELVEIAIRTLYGPWVAANGKA